MKRPTRLRSHSRRKPKAPHLRTFGLKGLVTLPAADVVDVGTVQRIDEVMADIRRRFNGTR